jgi:coniferyl-aldehyde dehydrogenase
LPKAFDPTEVTTFSGGPEVGQAFSALPFDHMIFTGATNIARHILTAAARNLVPVTLELGGKSPVVISRSAHLEQAIQRVMVGKTLNAGQICLAPDYLLVPEEKLEEVISLATQSVNDMYSSLRDNDQYTAIINERHHKRLSSYLEDARATRVSDYPAEPGQRGLQRRHRARSRRP